MPKRQLSILAAGLYFVASLGGCDGFIMKKPEPPVPEVVVPPHVAGTITEYARLETGGNCLVGSFGLVVGLGKNGSSQVPPDLLDYFKQYLFLHNIGSARAGTDVLAPERMLRDLDTAIVRVDGAIPPGAPPGTKFDVHVGALPTTDTKNLDGGALLPSEMRLAVGGVVVPGGPTKPMATAGGDTFLNPFLDPNKPQDLVKQREGRIIGGGSVLEANPIRLLLYQADHARAQHIQRRLNERFGEREPVASAKSSSAIEVTVPRSHRANYEHFLQLVMHLPMVMNQGAAEAHARHIAEAMPLPTADHNELALVWEAIGKQSLPIVQGLYASRNPSVAFHAARTGLRLEDESLAGDVILRFAESGGSPLQISAIEELGRAPGFLRASAVLHKLIDDENDLVRVAAYEAMLRRGDRSLITRVDVGKQFALDLVSSGRSYAIYATQTREPRIVLFGKDMAVCRPVYFDLPDDLVIVRAYREDEKLTIFRRIPRTGKYSDTFQTDFSVRTLITTLGLPSQRGPGGNIMGLNFSYGQVVRILYRMCKAEDINARFVLQPLPGIQRIYTDVGVGTVGRPDTPSQ